MFWAARSALRSILSMQTVTPLATEQEGGNIQRLRSSRFKALDSSGAGGPGRPVLLLLLWLCCGGVGQQPRLGSCLHGRWRPLYSTAQCGLCGGGILTLSITVGIGAPSAEAPGSWTRRLRLSSSFSPLSSTRSSSNFATVFDSTRFFQPASMCAYLGD